MTARRGHWALRLALLPLLTAGGVRAEEASPPSAASGYEERTVHWGLAQVLGTLDPSPEGKTVEGIEVASEEIVAATDPYPKALNLFHVRTRERVVLREVLLEVGAPFQLARAQETERNLLSRGLFAIARVVALQGSAPDRVRVLVVTKDLWSLRLNSEYNLVGSTLQYLRIRPTEQNLFGLGKRLSLDFILRLDTFSLGQAFTDPRLLGKELTLGEAAGVVLNRDTGKAEGSFGEVLFAKPLTTLETRWGYSLSGAWDVRRVREFRGESLSVIPGPDGVTPIAVVYDQRVFAAAAAYTRSFGRELKTNLSSGLGAYDRAYTPPDDAGLTLEQRTHFAAERLPRSEDATYVVSRARSFRAEYRTLRNLSTFALSERYQVGHSVVGEVRWAPGLSDSARYLQGTGSARYRWVLGDSVTGVTATATTRYWTRAADAEGGTRFVNRRFAAELLEVTPFVGPGRFALRGILDVKRFDLDSVPLFLGGGNGLRGVRPEALVGERRVLVNVEYRTRPWELRTLHVGGVLFYDAGSAFDHVPDFAHTLGLGLRFLLPQFDVEVLRLDFGYALRGPRASGRDGLSSSFGQATDYGRAFVAEPHE